MIQLNQRSVKSKISPDEVARAFYAIEEGLCTYAAFKALKAAWRRQK